MSRRNAILFLLAGFLLGIPYLFIRVAVDPETGFSPRDRRISTRLHRRLDPDSNLYLRQITF